MTDCAMLAEALPYGPLTLEETYLDVDGPKLFALRAAASGDYLLGLCVDEDVESLGFAYRVLDRDEFLRVRSGEVTLRDTYLMAPPGDLWLSAENSSKVVVHELAVEEMLAADYLPAEGVRLEITVPLR